MNGRMIQPEPPCECPNPGYCSRYKRDQDAYAHGVCSGKGLPGRPCPTWKSESYRRKWRLELDTVPPEDPRPPRLTPQLVKSSACVIKVGGPGTELKKMLSAMGMEPAPGCSCRDRMKKMDAWGPEECRKRKQEILGWLRQEYEKQGWGSKVSAGWKALTSGLALHLDPLDPFGSLVDEAIRRAESPSGP